MPSSLMRLFLTTTPLLLSPLLSGCGETVILEDEEGAFRLRYRCGAFRPVAQSTSEHSVVRSYAIRAVSHANQVEDLDSVRPLMLADAEGDRSELERLVVDYLCNGGGLADPIPKEPSDAPSVAELRRELLSREAELEVGSLAPDFRLPVLDPQYFEGQASFIRLSDHSGNYVLLTFGGPSCGPCVEEHIELISLWQRFRDRELSVLSVLHADTPERGWEWIREDPPASFPTLVDEDGAVADQYHVGAIPRTYLIGPSGDVVQTWLGWIEGRSEGMAQAFDQLLPVMTVREE